MIKAVIFDMFETLVTLFTGKTYFSEDIAQDLGLPIEAFRKYWQETDKEGNGLGLAIAKSLMELQGGEMKVEVDGDLFKVILSLKTCDAI